MNAEEGAAFPLRAATVRLAVLYGARSSSVVVGVSAGVRGERVARKVERRGEEWSGVERRGEERKEEKRGERATPCEEFFKTVQTINTGKEKREKSVYRMPTA